MSCWGCSHWWEHVLLGAPSGIQGSGAVTCPAGAPSPARGAVTCNYVLTCCAGSSMATPASGLGASRRAALGFLQLVLLLLQTPLARATAAAHQHLKSSGNSLSSAVGRSCPWRRQPSDPSRCPAARPLCLSLPSLWPARGAGQDPGRCVRVPGEVAMAGQRAVCRLPRVRGLHPQRVLGAVGRALLRQVRAPGGRNTACP